MTLSITFHGTRGSFPQGGPEYNTFGGNTSCVSLITQNNIYVIDAGTGLGKLAPLIQEHFASELHLFLSHLHMDHIAGLPSLQQMWNKNFRFHLYTAKEIMAPYGSLEKILNTYYTPPYFPIVWSEFPSQKTYHPFDMEATLHPTSECTVETIALNHPGGSCGYAFSIDNKKIVYLSDTNHTNGAYEKFLPFISKADLLIYDSTFNEDEHAHFPHFGHSTWEIACDLALKSNVKSLALYHHDYNQTDVELLSREEQAKLIFPNSFFARCNQKLTL